MKLFKSMDHPGQDEIDKFFKQELKDDAKKTKKATKGSSKRSV